MKIICESCETVFKSETVKGRRIERCGNISGEGSGDFPNHETV